MHNALRWFLLWTLFPFVIVAADPPPPLVRSVLSTNLPPFGLTGQALFRTANLPYLDWSNIVQQVIDTNAFQPASANLTNWSLISTNALTGKLDSNFWWAAWGSLSTNALTGKLDSNYWFTVWGAIATNALTAKLDSNWWWTAYGSTAITNASQLSGSFIASHLGNGTNTTFWQSNTVIPPVVIKPVIGTTTNRFEVWDTNGQPKMMITKDGAMFVGINTNDVAEFDQARIESAPLTNQIGRGLNIGLHFVGASNSASAATAINSFAYVEGYGEMGHVYGNQSWLFGNGTNNLSEAAGYMSTATWNSGNLTNWYGYLYSGLSGAASVGVNQWAFYGNTPSPSFLKGKLAVSPDALTSAQILYPLFVRGGYSETVSGLGNAQVAAFSTNAAGAGVGGSFVMGGKSGLGSDPYPFAFIKGAQETGGSYAGMFGIYVGKSTSENEERLHISSTGKIGIGTNSPAARLHLTADNSAPNVLQVDTTNRHDLMVVTTNGHLGIGTNDPQAVVDIQATNSGNGYMFRVGNPMFSSGTNVFVVTTNARVEISGTVRQNDNFFGAYVSRSVNNAGAETAQSAISFDMQTFNGAAYVSGMFVTNRATGIGTNSPSARLQVVSDNNFNNVLQIDTTNRHDLLTVTTNGHVGIGTNNPQAVLHVTGTNGPSQYIVQVENPMVVASTNLFYIHTNNTVNVNGILGMYGNIDFPTSRKLTSGGNSDLSIQVQNGHVYSSFNAQTFKEWNGAAYAELMRLTNVYVGIGTNDPKSALDVIGDNSSANILRAGTTNRPTLLVLTTNGYLGIGTNTPQCPLHITGTNGPSQYIVQVENPMVANATNIFTVNTNNCVQILSTSVERTLNVGGTGMVIGNAAYDFPRVILRGQHSAWGFGISINDFLLQNPDTSAEFWRTTTTGTGFGTNAPICELDVIANNANANILRAGTTNRPTLLTLTTNGVLSVNPGGGLNPVGCWGNLKMSDTNIVVCPGADVYTNACGTNFTSITTNGFYGCLGPGDAAALTNLYAGYYSVQAFMSYTGANGTSYEVGVFTNLVECTELEWKDTFDTPARARGNSLGGVIYLPAGCRTSLKIKDFGTGSSVAVTRVSLKIGTP